MRYPAPARTAGAMRLDTKALSTRISSLESHELREPPNYSAIGMTSWLTSREKMAQPKWTIADRARRWHYPARDGLEAGSSCVAACRYA